MDNVKNNNITEDIKETLIDEEIGQLSATENSSQEDETLAFHEATSVKETSPAVSHTAVVEAPLNQDENFDDEPDETILERLWGLTEMLPDPIRNYAGKMSNLTLTGVSRIYSFSCNTAWIVVSSAVILFAPAIFESERAQVKELQMSQEKQVLLGPAVVLGPKSARVKGN